MYENVKRTFRIFFIEADRVSTFSISSTSSLRKVANINNDDVLNRVQKWKVLITHRRFEQEDIRVRNLIQLQ